MANQIYNTTSTYDLKLETEFPEPDAYESSVMELLDLARSIEESKRPGYTLDSPDVLANFKKAGEMTGCTPMQAWGAYFYKHVAAILSYAKDENIEQAEPLSSRFADAINYLKLGYHMIKESKLEQEINNQQKLPF